MRRSQVACRAPGVLSTWGAPFILLILFSVSTPPPGQKKRETRKDVPLLDCRSYAVLAIDLIHPTPFPTAHIIAQSRRIGKSVLCHSPRPASRHPHPWRSRGRRKGTRASARRSRSTARWLQPYSSARSEAYSISPASSRRIMATRRTARAIAPLLTDHPHQIVPAQVVPQHHRLAGRERLRKLAVFLLSLRGLRLRGEPDDHRLT